MAAITIIMMMIMFLPFISFANEATPFNLRARVASSVSRAAVTGHCSGAGPSSLPRPVGALTVMWENSSGRVTLRERPDREHDEAAGGLRLPHR